MSVQITEATPDTISYVVGIPERQNEPIGPSNKPIPITFTVSVDNRDGQLNVGDHVDIIIRKLTPKEPQ